MAFLTKNTPADLRALDDSALPHRAVCRVGDPNVESPRYRWFVLDRSATTADDNGKFTIDTSDGRGRWLLATARTRVAVFKAIRGRDPG